MQKNSEVIILFAVPHCVSRRQNGQTIGEQEHGAIKICRRESLVEEDGG
jgi:hypothetical protein